ncbi:MAG: MOSC N-terminal beta barrel domain-containing protein, partial [Acidobacteriota bacterium]
MRRTSEASTMTMTMTTLYVAGLWRYPVKSLAGERLPAAALSADGVLGDRLVQVHGPEGVRTSRR